jgi:flagellin FlaB
MIVSKCNCSCEKESIQDCKTAETGISTMIIFIAAVLATSVAAGVLLSTTGMLQQQAEKTAQRAIMDVSTSMKVLYITGDRNQDSNSEAETSDSIQVLEINTKLASGSPDINISDVVISVSDGTNIRELTFNSSGTTAEHADSVTFVAIAIRDEDSSFDDSNIMSEGDLIKIMISTDASATNLNLDPNTPVTLRFIPQQGTETISKFTTPASYTKRYIELV